MLFTSFEFLVFYLVLYALVYLMNRYDKVFIRNFLLLVGSYFFYGNLHEWYPLLLLYVTVVGYVAGKVLERFSSHRKAVAGVSIGVSLCPLFFFKYAPLLNESIWLPVGLSFFTLQSLTYIWDCYRRKIEKSFGLLDVALFVAFFPTLLSGPIERARNLIPQLQRGFSYKWCNIVSGVQIFIWGAFKKLVIADNLGQIVDVTYTDLETAGGLNLALAALLYAIQIYADFSGYASMAVGIGRSFGIQLTDNFNFPYFAGTIKEFWKRWHISLTSWFTEYVYISMGGNRCSKWRWMVNIYTVFLLSGIWHGATWAFVIWGAMHGMMYLLERAVSDRLTHTILYRVVMLMGVVTAWIFFRIPHSGDAWYVVKCIFAGPWLPFTAMGQLPFSFVGTICLAILFLILELMLYHKCYPKGIVWHWFGFALLICVIAIFAIPDNKFVYFNF